jgi:excisionase family DNA binding protein
MAETKQPDYTVKEVAYYAGKSEVTIRREVGCGTIESYKVGGSRRIPHEAMVRYLHRDPFERDTK